MVLPKYYNQPIRQMPQEMTQQRRNEIFTYKGESWFQCTIICINSFELFIK